jgi:hypothetical protein
LTDGSVRVFPPAADTGVFDDSWNPLHPDRPEFHPLDFVFPLRVGAEWTFASPPATYYQRGNHKVTAFEAIKVPAGTFQCFRLEGESVFNLGKSYSETRRMTRWYCPTVKYMAKLQFELDIWQAYAPGARKVLTSELVDYKLATPIGALLPPGVAVHPPDESIPSRVRVLSGKWAGTWSNAVDSVLVVERIDSPSSATVLYTRDRAPALKLKEQYYGRHLATINDDGELQFKMRGGAATVTYVLTPSGELLGTYAMEGSRPLSIQMKRLE